MQSNFRASIEVVILASMLGVHAQRVVFVMLTTFLSRFVFLIASGVGSNEDGSKTARRAPRAERR